MSRPTVTPLSSFTRARLSVMFRDRDRAEAVRLLEVECGRNLPFCEGSTPEDLERLRFAALKLSGGNLKDLRLAIQLAKTDWRDLLLAAGFGYSTTAHLDWTPSIVA